MTKEKLIKLTKYMNDLSDKLNASIPDKHKDSPNTYKNFLKHEINLVKSKLEAAKLEAMVK